MANPDKYPLTFFSIRENNLRGGGMLTEWDICGLKPFTFDTAVLDACMGITLGTRAYDRIEMAIS